MTRISTTARISFCLSCLLISALLAADFVGLIPDPHKLIVAGRRSLCETLAINCSILASRGELKKIESNLEAVAARNADILSAALRRNDGQLRFEVGDHAANWHLDGNVKSNPTNIYVPITAGNKDWGIVEVRFRPLVQAGFFGILANPLIRLIGFTAALCLLLNYLFLKKTLSQLDPSRVIPKRVRAALDTLAEGLLVMDKSDRIILANRSFAQTVGCEPEKLQGSKASALAWTAVKDGPEMDRLPWETANREKSLQAGIPLALKVNKGDERTFIVNSSPITGDDGKQRGVLASFEDVTTLEAKRAELEKMLGDLHKSRQEIQVQNKELKLLATRDSLTGCVNRRAFFEDFEKHWSRAKRYKHPLSCIMIDLDHFKSINDDHGHIAGDMVLKKVAQALRQTARNTDIVCRYGGEEFSVLLPHINVDDAVTAAERFRRAVEDLKFSDFKVTASVGVSEMKLGAADPQQLLHQADVSLYMAKRSGRNQVALWDDSMNEVDPEESIAPTDSVIEDQETDIAIPFHAVTALLSALAYRDADTGAHSTRVADLCVATARGILSVTDSYILEMAALLHDIGKIGVPDAILLKPGPLTDEEWKVMAYHDRIGVEILRSSFASPKMAEIVDTHHAFFGGQGRHAALPTGKDIPLGARILSIADAYDAMVSDRAYRKGRTQKKAFEELRRCAGTQFDPDLVERFITIVMQHRADSPKEVQGTSKETALQIGIQIEQLARALDDQDFDALASLAGRLKATAAKSGVDSISEVASRLEVSAERDPDLTTLIVLTHELLDLCRSTQKAYVNVSSTYDEGTGEKDASEAVRRAETTIA